MLLEPDKTFIDMFIFLTTVLQIHYIEQKDRFSL